jgi:hypothetical protein
MLQNPAVPLASATSSLYGRENSFFLLKILNIEVKNWPEHSLLTIEYN